MNNKLKYFIFGLLGLLLALYFYNKYRVAPAVDFSKVELFDLEGKPVQLADRKGKKLVVSFGASWCGNCIEELGMIGKIKDAQLQDVEVVVISDEDMDRVRAFQQRKNYPFTFLKMNGSFASIGVNAIPTTYIFNTKFEIKDETVGYIDWEDPSTVEHLKKLME
jgi:thiol-disulfide isomerase/thioredoxin